VEWTALEEVGLYHLWATIEILSISSCCTIVNYRRPEWGVFVQPDMVVFQIQGKHAVHVPISEPCTPDASSIAVEWSGNVTAAGSTRWGYGLWSAVGVLRGIMTSKSCETSED